MADMFDDEVVDEISDELTDSEPELVPEVNPAPEPEKPASRFGKKKAAPVQEEAKPGVPEAEKVNSEPDEPKSDNGYRTYVSPLKGHKIIFKPPTKENHQRINGIVAVFKDGRLVTNDKQLIGMLDKFSAQFPEEVISVEQAVLEQARIMELGRKALDEEKKASKRGRQGAVGS